MTSGRLDEGEGARGRRGGVGQANAGGDDQDGAAVEDAEHEALGLVGAREDGLGRLVVPDGRELVQEGRGLHVHGGLDDGVDADALGEAEVHGSHRRGRGPPRSRSPRAGVAALYVYTPFLGPPKVARNLTRSFLDIAHKRCNSNDVDSTFELIAWELRATLIGGGRAWPTFETTRRRHTDRMLLVVQNPHQTGGTCAVRGTRSSSPRRRGHHQTGGICTNRGATRRRHAEARLLMLQNPHLYPWCHAPALVQDCPTGANKRRKGVADRTLPHGRV